MVIRRTTFLLFELLAGLLAGLGILIGAGVWFLSSGPISLTFLTPLVEQALDNADDAYTIRVEDTLLTWAGWKRAVDVRATNVTIAGEDGSIEATLPELSIGLSLRALVRGSVIPTSLDIFSPKISAIRSSEGKVDFGLVADESNGARFSPIIVRLIAQLLGPPDIERPLSNLRKISVLDADLTFDDQILGVSWRAPQANLVLQRSSVGLSVDADLNLEVGGQRSRLMGELSYERLGQTVSLAVRFRDLNPSLIAGATSPQALLSAIDLPVNGALGIRMRSDGQIDSLTFDLDSSRGRLAGEVTLTSDGLGLIGTTRFQGIEIAAFADQVPQFAPLAPIRAPIDGRAEFEATTDGRISRLQFDMNAGAGELVFSAFYPEPIDIAGMHLRGNIVDDMTRLRIDEASIDFGGPIATIQASAIQIHDDVHIQLEGNVAEVSVREIDRYWPKSVAPLPRDWVVKNIVGGTFSQAHLSMTARLVDGAIDAVDIQSIDGTMKIRDASVNYLDPLPIFTNVNASASFTADHFNIDVASARLNDVRVERAAINFSGLASENVRAAIEMHVRGPAATIAGLLDHEPLELIDALNLNPRQIKGDVDARINFEFPLLTTLTKAMVKVNADGRIFDATVDETPYGIDFSNGELSLHVDNEMLEAIGVVHLNGVRTALDWRTNFSADADIRSQIGLSGRLDDRERKRVGMIPIPFLTGPIQLDIDYSEYNEGHTVLVIDGDISSAKIDIDLIDWHKAVQEQGKFGMFMVTQADGTVDIESFTLSSGDMNVVARIVPKADFTEVFRIEFDKLNFSGNELRGAVDALPEGGYRIALDGNRLDVAPLLKKRRLPDVPYAPETQGVPLIIQANISEVTDGPDRQLANVVVNARYDGQNWQAVIIGAEVGGSGRLDLKYQPTDSGYSLQITSDDAGQALKSLNWTDRAQNGALAVSGTRASLLDPMVGNFKVTDYRLIEAPVLARLLQVASLTGILSALGQGGGLDFVTLDGEFSYLQGNLKISDARTYGSSIGITVEGSVDLESDTVDIKGTVVPAYTINRVLGVIPVLGRLLTGGKDEGVFAATYNIRGSIENPTITANPLLALAPGFLRSLLGLFGRGSDKDDDGGVAPVVPVEFIDGSDAVKSNG
jgi:hypothetical protein